MIDIAHLRPADDTPGAISAAIARCAAAGRGALAEIERLKSERAGLLLAGLPGLLDENLAELTRAMGSATMISELIDQLMSPAGASDQPTNADPRGSAIDAIAACSTWWRQHGSTVITGVQLAVAALAAVVTAAKSGTPIPADRASNFAPFPRPVA